MADQALELAILSQGRAHLFLPVIATAGGGVLVVAAILALRALGASDTFLGITGMLLTGATIGFVLWYLQQPQGTISVRNAELVIAPLLRSEIRIPLDGARVSTRPYVRVGYIGNEPLSVGRIIEIRGRDAAGSERTVTVGAGDEGLAESAANDEEVRGEPAGPDLTISPENLRRLGARLGVTLPEIPEAR